ncbi:hypothetical protein AQ611_17315 [Burkholderia singularis]|nr:hypothetical protein AQ611_17315 [Burkholderia sp. Bp7605]
MTGAGFLLVTIVVRRLHQSGISADLLQSNRSSFAGSELAACAGNRYGIRSIAVNRAACHRVLPRRRGCGL